MTESFMDTPSVSKQPTDVIHSYEKTKNNKIPKSFMISEYW